MDIEPLIRIISDLCNTLELTKYWLPVFCPLFLSFPNSTISSAHWVSLESTIYHYCNTKHTLQHQTNAHSHMGSKKRQLTHAGCFINWYKHISSCFDNSAFVCSYFLRWCVKNWLRPRCRLQCVNNVSTNVLWWRCKRYMMVSQDFYRTFYRFCSCKIHQVPNVTLAMSDISSACRPDFHIYLGDGGFTFCLRLPACACVRVCMDPVTYAFSRHASLDMFCTKRLDARLKSSSAHSCRK